MNPREYFKDSSRRQVAFAILVTFVVYTLLGPSIAAGAYPIIKQSKTADNCKVMHIEDAAAENKTSHKQKI